MLGAAKRLSRFFAAAFAAITFSALTAGCMAATEEEGQDPESSAQPEGDEAVASVGQRVVSAGWHTVQWCAAVRYQPFPCSYNYETLCAGRQFYAASSGVNGGCLNDSCCSEPTGYAHGHADDGTVGYIRWDALN